MIKSNHFQEQSPERVLKQAHEFKQTFHQILPLPNNPNKSMLVAKVVDYELDQMKYSITRAKYQNNLFRKLQKADQQHRHKISKSLLLKDNKVQKNIAQNQQQIHKKYQTYTKHINDTHKRYHQEQHKKFELQKQQAIKLRKQIRQFYQKQEQRKKIYNQQQNKVSTCYQSALQKIQQIQTKNQQFSQKTQFQFNQSFIRNSPEKKNEILKLRATSLDFKKNQTVFLNSQLLLKQKQERNIQKFAKNQTSSLKAIQQKHEDCEKTKKRINQKIKRDKQRWAQQKKRVDEANDQIPNKCTSRMQRSLQTTFRHTFSTFRDSFSKWRVTGEFNRSKIKEKDDKRKEEILGIHEDITLKNKSVNEIDDKMLSMRQRAIKVASHYL